MKKDNFLTLLRATRVERALYIVSMILIPTAFANKITTDILTLSICCILLYSVSGIHNAKRDKDFQLPKYYKKFMIFLILTSLILSVTNLLIFIAVIVEIILGVVYNTISRKILFGDATVLGFSHAFIPILSSSFLVGLNLLMGFKCAILFYSFIWVLGNIRNQKDSKGDRKRGYRTYTTIIKNPRILTRVFIGLSFFIILLSLIVFRLNYFSLVILVFISLVYIIVNFLTDIEKDVLAMQVLRFVIILFSFMMVIGTTPNKTIICAEIILAFSFFLFILPDIKSFIYKKEQS